MDFTIKQFEKLLLAIKKKDYSFQTMEEFMTKPKDKVVVLRHDVDSWPKNALKLAQAEFNAGVKSTYYFRIVKISNDPNIIKEIANLGHEIGYHYEDLASSNGDMEIAIKSFEKNLNYFRTFYPVKTVCMHGSSMSEFDNRDLWKDFKLTDFGILGEPYLSIDYTNVLYLTDTGRCWDGSKYSVRDFVKSRYNSSFHSTSDIITALKETNLPDKIIFQSHTLWTDSFFIWWRLFIREKVRNNLKVIVLKMPYLKKMAFKLIESYSK